MSFTLAFQPSSDDKSEQRSIQQLITRINEERGAFRNVSEETLRDEIAKATGSTGNEDSDEAVSYTHLTLPTIYSV